MKFKDFCTFKEGYVNPSQKIASYFDGPIKWLRATDLNNSYVYNTSRTLAEEGFKSAGKSSILFKPDTIAISKSGTIGRIGILKDYMCGNRAIINIEVNQEKYVFYWLLNQQNYIQNLAVGSVQKNLYISVLEQLEIADRPLREQKAIADILSALDDKIELNNQINKNLEEMAQAIFKSWFVDFEFPNEKGDPYKSSGGEFENTQNGEIPRGWKVALVGEQCNVVRGASPRPITDPKYFSNGTIHWIKISDATASSSIYINSTKEFCTKLAIAKSRYVEKGTLILSNSASVGIPKILNISGCIHDGWLAFNNYQEISRNYLYHYLLNNYRKLFSIADGSVQKNLNTSILKNMEIIVPERRVLSLFDSLIQPIFDKIRENVVENDLLSNLRDTLLPKLMSGEIRVPLENEGRHQDEQLQRV
jgi:type I restriction enzyme S subunit